MTSLSNIIQIAVSLILAGGILGALAVSVAELIGLKYKKLKDK
jgi:hypothetical protein